ncbi:MAG: TetR/AcrR family transcriptional regulator [Methyloligellaceae bacterium]
MAEARKVQRRPKEEREADILQAARSVFSERGYDDASITEIARRAGVVEGTIYKYFQNKRDLLFRLMIKVLEALNSGAKAGVHKTDGVRGQLRFLIWWHLQAFVDDPGLCRLFIREVRSNDRANQTVLYEAYRRYTSIMVRTLEGGVESGDLRRDLPLPMIRDMVYGTIEHIAWAWVAGQGTLNIDKIADDLSDMVMGGIAIPGHSERTVDGTVRRLERFMERIEAKA